METLSQGDWFANIPWIAEAVRAMIGVRLNPSLNSWSLIAWLANNPSITGIWRSWCVDALNCISRSDYIISHLTTTEGTHHPKSRQQKELTTPSHDNRRNSPWKLCQMIVLAPWLCRLAHYWLCQSTGWRLLFSIVFKLTSQLSFLSIAVATFWLTWLSSHSRTRRATN